MNKLQLTIGSDPEWFVRNKKTGKIVSSIPLIKNTKHNPINLGDGFTFYTDNVAVEGTIPPAESKEEFIKNLEMLKNKINERLAKHNCEVVPIASNLFAKDQLRDPGANEIGCNPFFLSHSLEMAEPPRLPDGYRSSGFHWHIGRKNYKKLREDEFLIDPMSKAKVINYCDYFVGIASVLFDNSKESISRKSIYTQTSGSHRPTPYGAEYRPLSSNCMRSKELIGLIYDLTLMAVDAANEDKLINVNEGEVVDCINKHQRDVAIRLLPSVVSQDVIKRIMALAN